MIQEIVEVWKKERLENFKDLIYFIIPIIFVYVPIYFLHYVGFLLIWQFLLALALAGIFFLFFLISVKFVSGKVLKELWVIFIHRVLNKEKEK